MSTRERVSSQMRSRLLTNRHGKLTSAQWKDMVTEPLGVMLLLLAPANIILGPRLLRFATRFLVLGLVALVLIVLIPKTLVWLALDLINIEMVPVQFLHL